VKDQDLMDTLGQQLRPVMMRAEDVMADEPAS